MEIEKIVPVAESPLDAYRGSGRHSKSNAFEMPKTPKPIVAEETKAPDVPDVVVLDIPAPVKAKRQRKKKQQSVITIVATDVTISFD